NRQHEELDRVTTAGQAGQNGSPRQQAARGPSPLMAAYNVGQLLASLVSHMTNAALMGPDVHSACSRTETAFGNLSSAVRATVVPRRGDELELCVSACKENWKKLHDGTLEELYLMQIDGRSLDNVHKGLVRDLLRSLNT